MFIYINDYFYPRVNFEHFLREGGMNQQYAGIDVQFNANNQEYLVDEKGFLTRATIQNTFVLITRMNIRQNRNQLLHDLQNGPINLPNSESRYMLSSQLREKPLNIDMTKEEYIASGAVEARYMVYRDRIEDIL